MGWNLGFGWDWIENLEFYWEMGNRRKTTGFVYDINFKLPKQSEKLCQKSPSSRLASSPQQTTLSNDTQQQQTTDAPKPLGHNDTQRLTKPCAVGFRRHALHSPDCDRAVADKNQSY
jgi:hypothetical protein